MRAENDWVLQVYLFIMEEQDVLGYIYYVWSILHLLFRASVSITTTSRVHEVASHASLNFVQTHVLSKDYNLEVIPVTSITYYIRNL